MANDGTGTGWSETAPADSDSISDGATEIRDLRKGVRIRVDKEHDGLSASSGGGEHKEGSAKAYSQSSSPSNRPDGSTALDSNDDGRLWIDTDDGLLKRYNGSTTSWDDIIVSNVVDGAVGTVKIADNAVDKDKINSDIAGAALSQAAGGELDVQVDGSTIEVDSGSLGVIDGGIDTAQIADNAITTAKFAAGSGFTESEILSFTGDNSNGRKINLNFAPDYLMWITEGRNFTIMAYRGEGSGNPPVGPAHLSGSTIYTSAIQWDNDGFTFRSINNFLNGSGEVYHGLAVKVH